MYSAAILEYLTAEVMLLQWGASKLVNSKRVR